MRTILIAAIAFLLFPIIQATGQQTSNLITNAYQKTHLAERKPVPYHPLRESDIMWSKKIWRMLDLKEKINLPLYYPTIDENKGFKDNRFSLISLLFWGLDSGRESYWDSDEFLLEKTKEQIDVAFDAKADTTLVPDVANPNGPMVQKIIPAQRKIWEVTRLLMMEEWYFDKQRAMMEVKIIGLCPIRVYEKSSGTAGTNPPPAASGPAPDPDQKDLVMADLFWAYFLPLREIFVTNEVFNPNNDAERRNFDDIFFKRRFSSYIYQETNVYNNRRINQYSFGLDAQLESEKIKDYMFKIEHDLWEF